jgi:hypothetical protein
MGDWAELRAQLEQDNHNFLKTELAVSFTLAGMAETEYQLGEREAGGRSLDHAEEGYATLCRFLADPKHAGHLTRGQLQELHAGVTELRQKLDEVRLLRTPH